MASHQKQPQLNGAYYGPAIPPPKSSHRPGRSGRRGGCCCLFDCIFDCLCNCGCCLLSCVFKIICSILVTIAIILLVIFFIIHPKNPQFHATNASLTTFNYSNNLLAYNLDVNFTFGNPNHHIGIYYDTIEANVFYQDQRLATKEVDPFFQGTQNTTEIGPVTFSGSSAIKLGSSNDYDSQKSEGLYDIVVRLHLKARYKLGVFKTGKMKEKVKCSLSVPASSNSGKTFEATKCHYYY